MINRTSLTHPAMVAKIRQGMRLEGLGKGELMNGHAHRTYITNRQGRNIIRCSYWPSSNSFQFWISGVAGDATEIIKSVLRSAQLKA